MARIYLSPPHVGPRERELLLDAFDSNWIAPLGPHVNAFEEEFAAYVGMSHACALSSGTAALHLAMLCLGIGPGDEVITATMTFAATANAIVYCGARPVFLDSAADTWVLDPQLVEDELARRAAAGTLPKAVLTVDLYGQCCDYEVLSAICGRYDVPLLEDAAEALGSRMQGRAAGAFGKAAAFSFNGNKIITTSGGGMLVSEDVDLIARARYLATQARQPVLHYEHVDVGFNYRLSNLLAAVGRGQLEGLDAKVNRRRELRGRYAAALEPLGLSVLQDAPGCRGNSWLTCAFAPSGEVRDRIIETLASQDIESRPLWKPMHQQPIYADHDYVGRGVSDELFARGICLPTGSALTDEDQHRVIEGIQAAI